MVFLRLESSNHQIFSGGSYLYAGSNLPEQENKTCDHKYWKHEHRFVDFFQNCQLMKYDAIANIFGVALNNCDRKYRNTIINLKKFFLMTFSTLQILDQQMQTQMSKYRIAELAFWHVLDTIIQFKHSKSLFSILLQFQLHLGSRYEYSYSQSTAQHELSKNDKKTLTEWEF